MTPWYSVTYSDGLEHVFISYKLVVVVLLFPVVVGLFFKLLERFTK